MAKTDDIAHVSEVVRETMKRWSEIAREGAESGGLEGAGKGAGELAGDEHGWRVISAQKGLHLLEIERSRRRRCNPLSDSRGENDAVATVRVQRLAASWALKGEAGARVHALGELVDKRLQFTRAQRGIPGSDMQIELRGDSAGGGRWRAAEQAAEASCHPRRILERGDRVRVTAARPSPDS